MLTPLHYNMRSINLLISDKMTGDWFVEQFHGNCVNFRQASSATVSPNDRVCKVIPFERLLQTAVTSVDLVHISSIDYVEVRFLFVQCLHYLIYWRSIGKSV